MSCLSPLVLAAVLAVCNAVPHIVQARDTGLSENQMSQLTSQYGLMKAPFGDFSFAFLYESEQKVTLSSGEKHLAATYLVVFNGACEGWLVFHETDRVYTWVDGKATIDLAKPDGTIESVCLGNSLEDSNCVYSLNIPANWVSTIRPEGYFIFTATSINGDVSAGHQKSVEEMEAAYGNEYADLLSEVAKCY